MILTLDIGNTQIYAGVFDEDDIVLRFRKTSVNNFSSDEFGIFMRSALRENGIDPEAIRAISLCSVVPSVIYSINSACIKYFDLNPFVLGPGIKTGLRIKYKTPTEVGADRIANAIAASHLFKNQGIIIIDLGTATTFCVVNKNRDYLGGAIMPGMKISTQALEEKTAKLPSVEIVQPKATLGQTTISSLQSGLYYSHLGAMKEIIGQLKRECFVDEAPVIIGTGGLSQLFDDQAIFNERIPDLALQGLKLAYTLNR